MMKDMIILMMNISPYGNEVLDNQPDYCSTYI